MNSAPQKTIDAAISAAPSSPPADRLELILAKGKVPLLIVGDTQYEMTPAYKRGANAMHRGVSFTNNPFRANSQKNCDWDMGHVNESEGLHRSIDWPGSRQAYAS